MHKGEDLDCKMLSVMMTHSNMLIKNDCSAETRGGVAFLVKPRAK